MNWYLNAFKNYTNFYGRTSRTCFWMFVLFNMVFAISAYSIDVIFDLGIGKLGFGLIYIVYGLISFIPGLAIAIRRLHDIDKSGWYLFLALIPLVGSFWLLFLFATESNQEENAYGSNPKEEEKSIASFINDDKTCTTILIIALIWMFVNTAFWSLISQFIPDIFSRKSYAVVREIINLIWGFFPLFLTLAVKNRKWKIALLLLSMLYLLYFFIQLIKSHLAVTNQFQF